MKQINGSNQIDHDRRGIALLLVLGVLIIVVTISAGIVRVVSVQRLDERFTHWELVADDISVALEEVNGPVLEWLENKSAQVVLPTDSLRPYVDVLHDQFSLGNDNVEIQITAWDQCGMVPYSQVVRGSPLRLIVPSEVRRRFDSIKQSNPDSIGLDCFLADSGLTSGVVVFPQASDSNIVEFHGLIPATFNLHDSDSVSTHDQRRVPSIGEWIATHNENPPVININTAPMVLVEAAMRQAGRGGIEAIRNARTEGKQASSGILSVQRSNQRKLKIVTSSDRWSFRIDVRVNQVRKAWWMVYIKEQNRRYQSTSWRCVQRLRIAETISETGHE